MECFDQSKDDEYDMTDEEISEHILGEFTNLETAIFSYMNNMKEYMTDKEIMRITKRDSNYFIKQWGKINWEE